MSAGICGAFSCPVRSVLLPMLPMFVVWFKGGCESPSASVLSGVPLLPHSRSAQECIATCICGTRETTCSPKKHFRLHALDTLGDFATELSSALDRHIAKCIGQDLTKYSVAEIVGVRKFLNKFDLHSMVFEHAANRLFFPPIFVFTPNRTHILWTSHS